MNDIKDLLKDRGISYHELFKMLGSPANGRRLNSAKSKNTDIFNYNVQTILDICRILNIPVESLFSENSLNGVNTGIKSLEKYLDKLREAFKLENKIFQIFTSVSTKASIKSPAYYRLNSHYTNESEPLQYSLENTGLNYLLEKSDLNYLLENTDLNYLLENSSLHYSLESEDSHYSNDSADSHYSSDSADPHYFSGSQKMNYFLEQSEPHDFLEQSALHEKIEFRVSAGLVPKNSTNRILEENSKIEFQKSETQNQGSENNLYMEGGRIARAHTCTYTGDGGVASDESQSKADTAEISVTSVDPTPPKRGSREERLDRERMKAETEKMPKEFLEKLDENTVLQFRNPTVIEYDVDGHVHDLTVAIFRKSRDYFKQVEVLRAIWSDEPGKEYLKTYKGYVTRDYMDYKEKVLESPVEFPNFFEAINGPLYSLGLKY